MNNNLTAEDDSLLLSLYLQNSKGFEIRPQLKEKTQLCVYYLVRQQPLTSGDQILLYSPKQNIKTIFPSSGFFFSFCDSPTQPQASLHPLKTTVRESAHLLNLPRSSEQIFAELYIYVKILTNCDLLKEPRVQTELDAHDKMGSNTCGFFRERG